MSVLNGQLANQNTFNNAFMSRTAATTSTIAIVALNNTAPASLATIANAQEAINETFDAVGMTGILDTTRKDYSSNNVVTNGDSHKVAIGKVDAKFDGTSGHAHDGTTGGGPKIIAANLNNFNNLWAIFQEINVTAATGASTDISTQMSGKVSGGTSSATGVITAAPDNEAFIVDKNTKTFLEDGSGQRIYTRITESAGVWTATYYTNEAGVETAASISPATDIRIIFREVFTSEFRPTIPTSPLEFGTLDVTGDVVDASTATRGVVSLGTQSFAGNKTFTGTISASNLSGTNTGDVTLGAFGSSPDPKGATLSGQVLTLQPADATNAGSVSTTTQTFAGAKTFSGSLIASASFIGNVTTNSSATGANQSIATPATLSLRVTNASLTSISKFTTPVNNQIFVLVNATGASITINNANAAADDILTGTGANMTMTDGSSVLLYYDATSTRWRVIGGAGGSGGGALIVTGSEASPTAITAGGGIAYVEGTDARQAWFVNTAGGEVNVTASPQIAAATTLGRELWILGTSDDDYIVLEDGTGLKLNSDWYSYAGTILKLIWNGSTWRETGRL